jgi:hypothetical protein
VAQAARNHQRRYHGGSTRKNIVAGAETLPSDPRARTSKV